MSNEEYEIGYAKPPQKTRFRKGTSGNPMGRPRGRKNLQTIFRSLMNEKVRVTEGGKPKMMTRGEAIIRQLMNRALSGDLKTMLEVMKWNQSFEALGDSSAESSQDIAFDKALVESFIKELENSAGFSSEVSHPDQSDWPKPKGVRPLNLIPGAWEGDDE